ncbi:MAG: DsbA family protein [Devosia sp.]|uniref:DsbA family protein n=1 Tax=Devosia sp. TaxID=1871048 RepID=UPI0024CAA512|nr:DsbA family protein [Devosia sp.]UYO00424.1 MAG: DsbA family protein [Devosia sp.]
MNRLSLVLVALVGILAGALGYSQLNRPEPQTDEAAVRAIVEGILTEREAAEPDVTETAEIDPAVLNPMIETYLMSDPKLLQRMSVALDDTLRTEEQERAQSAIAEFRSAIYDADDHVILGNPEGDVTLVEFFDYNCGYCRSALPDLATLLAEDPNLKVILKEFPILSAESVDAARVAVLVGEEEGIDYWAFHEALFTSRAQVDKEVALAAAADLGLSRVSLELRMQEPEVSETIQNSYKIAQALGITGTPTYIIGNEIIPGAIGADDLRARIANMRECGKSDCG